MRPDKAGEFTALEGFYFAGRRASRDRKCQQCKTELITGEPVFGIHASFLAFNHNKYSIGAYCVPCSVAVMEEMKERLAEASAWLTEQHKELEPYFVAKALGEEKDRNKLASMLRRQVPKHLCPKCFHEKEKHAHFLAERTRWNSGKYETVQYVTWKCSHSDETNEDNSTVRCCGCAHGPKINQEAAQALLAKTGTVTP